VAHLVPTLFPGTSGGLYIEQAGASQFERIGHWGIAAPHAPSFTREACWALRRGQMHATDAVSGTACCHHLEDESEAHSVCLPLRGHGTMPGLLTLRGGSRLETAFGHRQARLLANTVGLAVVNIRLRDHLRQASIRDALTGLFNRRYLEETLLRELARTEREGGSLSLLMVDLDHFKVINDTFGHEVGDRVLQATARLLEHHVRTGDVACRYGGEEFAVLLPNTTLPHATSRANQLRVAMRALPLPAPADGVTLTMSVGVATSPGQGRSAADLIHAADEGLYEAKRGGRDRVHVATAAAPSQAPAV
jgi:diguanylate cyclase (GGDEF)-like protein